MRQSVLGSGRTQWGWVHACSCTNECGEGHIGESHGNPLCSPVWIEYIDFYHSKIASLLCDLWQMPRMPSLPQVYHIFMASETHQQGWLNNSQSKWSKSITVADPRHLHFSSQENIPHVFAAKQQDGLSAFPCGTILQEIRMMMFLCDQFGVLFYAILFFLHLWLSECYFVLYKHYRFDQALCNLSQESWRQKSCYLIQRYVVHGCFSVFFHVVPSCNLLLVLPSDSQSYSCSDKIKGLNLWGSCYTSCPCGLSIDIVSLAVT